VHDTDLDTPNAIHQHSGPRVAWTRINAAENIPGVLTPLGFEFWLQGVDVGAHTAFAAFGVIPHAEAVRERPADEKVGGAFYGRFSVNVGAFARLAELTPGGSAAAFEQGIFGEVRSESLAAPSRVRYPLIALKAPPIIAVLPWLVRRRAEQTRAWWRRFTGTDPATSDARAQLSEAIGALKRAVHVQMLATFVAQGMYDKIGELTTRLGRPDLQLEVCTGYGGLEETRMVSALHEVAHGRRSLIEFLNHYGARCAGENDLSAHSWRERPAVVETLARKYREAPDGRVPDQRTRARIIERAAAERRLLDLLPPAKRPAARLLLRAARRYIPLREEAKSVMAMAMDAGRFAARNRGRELAASGHLDDPEDIFQLTLAEALGQATAELRSLVRQRHELRARYELLDLPPAWFGNPQPVLAGTGTPGDGEEILGIAAASGVAEGRARVILDVDDIDSVDYDEILVCRTTDPSWASVFHLVAGVVVDIGGTGSHGAIVSREMGLPCVINTGYGTSVLKTGDLLRVDGTIGTVTVLEPAGRTATPDPLTKGVAS